jgi:hypothetical protein
MTPHSVDIANGIFETFGAICSWLNVYSYYKQRKVAGIFWPSTIFYSVWGLWNLFYYPSLDQWFSFAGGIILTSGNLVWVLWVMKDKLFGKSNVPN